MKSNWKRISALVLSLALLLCAAVPAMAESAAKDETVYILSDAQGQARRIIVSDWLKNPDKLDELTDATRLQNLTVVEGNATFERDGERLTWDADGKDVYYQGDSDEELPLTLQITYLVDGEEVPAADMAGKSGRRAEGPVCRSVRRPSGQRSLHQCGSDQRRGHQRRRPAGGAGRGPARPEGPSGRGGQGRQAARDR